MTNTTQTSQLVEVDNMCKFFDLGRGRILHAVDKVSFKIKDGETLGLVGESGCGKTTLGRVLVRMYEPTSGKFSFGGQALEGNMTKEQRRLFSRQVQMIFQDPYQSLNPRMTVGDIIAEGPDIHGIWKGIDRQKETDRWLNYVGLLPEHAYRFPHEFSGGQRQRIGIARALALKPKFVVCDEPISALDVSVQAQIVNLLQGLKKELGLTMLFIGHGLSMVRFISDRMAVMYLGQIIEMGPSEQVYDNPLHPYTQALVAANPRPDPVRERLHPPKLLSGEVTSPVNPKEGCRFAGRCPIAKDICRTATPKLNDLGQGRFAACHFVTSATVH